MECSAFTHGSEVETLEAGRVLESRSGLADLEKQKKSQLIKIYT
jgi:hypothetical protein